MKINTSQDLTGEEIDELSDEEIDEIWCARLTGWILEPMGYLSQYEHTGFAVVALLKECSLYLPEGLLPDRLLLTKVLQCGDLYLDGDFPEAIKLDGNKILINPHKVMELVVTHLNHKAPSYFRLFLKNKARNS